MVNVMIVFKIRGILFAKAWTLEHVEVKVIGNIQNNQTEVTYSFSPLNGTHPSKEQHS